MDCGIGWKPEWNRRKESERRFPLFQRPMSTGYGYQQPPRPARTVLTPVVEAPTPVEQPRPRWRGPRPRGKGPRPRWKGPRPRWSGHSSVRAASAPVEWPRPRWRDPAPGGKRLWPRWKGPRRGVPVARLGRRRDASWSGKEEDVWSDRCCWRCPSPPININQINN